jgi:hypothetical protein
MKIKCLIKKIGFKQTLTKINNLVKVNKIAENQIKKILSVFFAILFLKKFKKCINKIINNRGGLMFSDLGRKLYFQTSQQTLNDKNYFVASFREQNFTAFLEHRIKSKILKETNVILINQNFKLPKKLKLKKAILVRPYLDKNNNYKIKIFQHFLKNEFELLSGDLLIGIDFNSILGFGNFSGIG